MSCDIIQKRERKQNGFSRVSLNVFMNLMDGRGSVAQCVDSECLVD